MKLRARWPVLGRDRLEIEVKNGEELFGLVTGPWPFVRRRGRRSAPGAEERYRTTQDDRELNADDELLGSFESIGRRAWSTIASSSAPEFKPALGAPAIVIETTAAVPSRKARLIVNYLPPTRRTPRERAEQQVPGHARSRERMPESPLSARGPLGASATCRRHRQPRPSRRAGSRLFRPCACPRWRA